MLEYSNYIHFALCNSTLAVKVTFIHKELVSKQAPKVSGGPQTPEHHRDFPMDRFCCALKSSVSSGGAVTSPKSGLLQQYNRISAVEQATFEHIGATFRQLPARPCLRVLDVNQSSKCVRHCTKMNVQRLNEAFRLHVQKWFAVSL